MSEMKTIDARGLSCPEPVILTHQAIQKLGKGTIEVLVDTGTAKDNVTRMGKSSGWKVDVKNQPDGSYKIRLTK